MPSTFIIKPAIRTRRQTTRAFRGVLNGAYTTGGDPIDLTAATDPQFSNDGIRGQFDLAAHQAYQYVAKLVRYPAGYLGEIVLNPSATGWNNAYLIKWFSAPGVELAAAAYPAAMTGDVYEIEVRGPNGIF